MTILRWYIARVHQSREPSGDDRKIRQQNLFETRLDVQIDVATEEFEKVCADMLPQIQGISDELRYWRHESQVEGHTYSGAIFHALINQNVLLDSDMKRVVEERTIAEDMVFLQCVDNPIDLERLIEVERLFDAEENDLDLTSLISDLPQARWIDFTIPARRMAKRVYTRLLAAESEGENDRENDRENSR